MNIVLIGIMGAGKTSVGKILAAKLGYAYIDMDEFIESSTEKTVTQLFAEGEEIFREAETEACKSLAKQDELVISTGGGVVRNAENMDYLKENSVMIYLKRDIDKILNRIDSSTRPLIRDNPQKLYTIMDERRNLYEAYGEIHIENNATVEETVAEICLALKGWKNENHGD